MEQQLHENSNTINPFEDVYVFDGDKMVLCKANSLGRADTTPIELEEYISFLEFYLTSADDNLEKHLVQEFFADFFLKNISHYEKRPDFSFDNEAFFIFSDTVLVNIPRIAQYKHALHRDIQVLGLPSSNGYAHSFLSSNSCVMFAKCFSFVQAITKDNLEKLRLSASAAYSNVLQNSKEDADIIISELKLRYSHLAKITPNNYLYRHETALFIKELEYLKEFEASCIQIPIIEQAATPHNRNREDGSFTALELVALINELEFARYSKQKDIESFISKISGMSKSTINTANKKYRTDTANMGYESVETLNTSRKKIYTALSELIPTNDDGKFDYIRDIMTKFNYEGEVM